MKQRLVLAELPAGPPWRRILVLRLVVHLVALIVILHMHGQRLDVDRDWLDLSQDIHIILLVTNQVVVVFNRFGLPHFLFFRGDFARSQL